MSSTSVFEHPWLGGLFGDPEMRGIWAAEAQLAHMLRFEAAWTRALAAVGRASGEEAEKTAAMIEAFTPDVQSLLEGTRQDGVPVPDLVRQLKAALGGSAIHTGATSQDVVDTALALTMVETVRLVQFRLDQVDAALGALNQRFGGRRLMGRTRMQAATEIRVSDRLAKWRAPMAAHLDRLAEMLPRISRLQIGGASGDRAALGGDADAILKSMESAFSMSAGDRAWHATRDGVAEFASNLSLITGSLGTIGQDVCLMAQQGIDDVTLAGGGSSSAMPHKSNPVSAELLVTLARFNATQVAGLHHAMVHEQERSGAAWALEWMILPQMAMATGRATNATLDVLRSIERMGAE